MAAYIIVRMNVKDPNQYAEYTRLTPEIIEKFGGRFLVRGGDLMTLEGPEEERRIVLLEFPSQDKAAEFYHSPEYSEARKLREGAAEGEFVLVEGVD